MAVLDELRSGRGVDELLMLFRVAGYRLEQVAQFAQAAVSWWHHDAPKRWTRSVAAAGMESGLARVW